MLRLGLTGGIGSGKSTVAGMLADLGAVIVDADQVARDLVVPGSEALDELVASFGAQILRADGCLDRAALARVAFATPEATACLNEIMHPRIAQESARRMAKAPAPSIVVYDMPLLVETGQHSVVDAVIVVDLPPQEQVRRAVELRGLDRADVERRMLAQASREERMAVADFVIDNAGTLEQTRSQVAALWPRLRSLALAGGADG